MILLLLPGMGGNGRLFEGFIRLLPADVEARIVDYPVDRHLTYEELADHAGASIPATEPYVILAESYSGPVAAQLAARAAGNLKGLILVCSFVSRPLGSLGSWLAPLVRGPMFRCKPPDWLLRHVLLEEGTAAELLAEVRQAIEFIRPDVLAGRARSALRANFSEILRLCRAPVTWIHAESDRVVVRRRLANEQNVVRIPGPHLLLQCNPGGCVEVLKQIGILE